MVSMPSSQRLHVVTCYTYLRAEAESSGVIVVSNQNITLSLPEEDLRGPATGLSVTRFGRSAPE